MYFIPQITSNDCLFTAFKNLLANLRKDEKYLYLQEDEKHGPYSFLEIIEMGKSFGLDLFGFESEDKKELCSCNGVPVILNIKRGNKGLHSVYVYKVTKKRVYFLDSDVGKTSMKFGQFISLWDGTGLMLRHFNDQKDELETPIIKAKKSPLCKILQVLSAISFIVGIYFLDNVTSIYLPMGLILEGVILEILTKILQIKDMKRFDSDSEKFLPKISNRNFSEFLPRREKLKSSIFSAKNNYLFYFLCCGFVIFVILLNNPFNIACIFVPIVLAAIQSLALSPKEKKKNFEIEQMEVNFSNEKNHIYAGRTLNKIQNEAYGFSYSILIKNGIGILLLFVSAFLTLKIFDAFDLINLFFLLFTEIFLYQNLIPIFSYESRQIEKKLDYMRFINLLQ